MREPIETDTDDPVRLKSRQVAEVKAQIEMIGNEMDRVKTTLRTHNLFDGLEANTSDFNGTSYDICRLFVAGGILGGSMSNLFSAESLRIPATPQKNEYFIESKPVETQFGWPNDLADFTSTQLAVVSDALTKLYEKVLDRTCEILLARDAGHLSDTVS